MLLNKSLVILIAVAFLAGCNSRPEVAQVSGIVLYPDGSVPQGGVCAVRFEPTADSTTELRKGASGAIQEDGTFKLSTRKPGDGVYLGEYAVTFAVWKGPRDPTSLIKDIYTNASTSPYKVVVDGDIEDLKFEIEPK
ncbi:MAG: hypothetical protein ACR2NU_06105 [Aeoliella sp.]